MGRLTHALYSRLPLRVRRDLERRKPYPLAQVYLKGLKGIEIGGSAHNAYHVDAINIDRAAVKHESYVAEETRLAGDVLHVDLVAEGDDLPFTDKSVDFVLASHVIEHFPDPVRALLEWERVARRYVFLVVPHRDRTFDAGRPLTTVDELLERHRAGLRSDEDKHWSVWDLESFLALCDALGLRVVATEDPDRKVGNGFAVVIATDGEPPRVPPGP
jgi:SAM-dependent methyltransferase